MGILLALLFTLQAHAETTATIKEVDANNKVIAIEPQKGGATKPGDRWVWESGDDSCIFQVYTVRGAIGSAKSSECDGIKKIKSGQNLKLSLIDAEAAAPTPVMPSKKERHNPDLPTDNESWYVLFGGGLSSNTYQGKFKDTIKQIDDLPGTTSRGSLTFDLGFYFPLSNFKTMIGGSWEGTGDVYVNDNSGKYSATISQGLYTISLMHFFGANIGNGWFLRGDAGLAKSIMILEQPGTSNQVTDKSGFGALLGGGYSIPCGIETRVLFFLNVASRNYGGDRFVTTTLGADFLF